MKKEIPLLEEIIYYKDSTINLVKQSNNLLNKQLLNCKSINLEQSNQVNILNKKLQEEVTIKSKYRNWAIGGCSLSLALLAILILK